jgi:hypothetical protein
MPERALSVSRQILSGTTGSRWACLGERRIGEQRGGYRLQRYRDPKFLTMSASEEKSIGLHRAGPVHHVEAVLPTFACSWS